MLIEICLPYFQTETKLYVGTLSIQASVKIATSAVQCNILLWRKKRNSEFYALLVI